MGRKSKEEHNPLPIHIRGQVTKNGNRIASPPPPYHAESEVVIPPPEEPKFYGADFAVLMQSLRKMGTLRERDKKRAGLTKGLRIMSHTHPGADSPSIADIELIILDVYHGKLSEIFLKHKLAFFLDGIWSIDEAVRVLQKFSRKEIPRHTEIDYFSFIPAFVFDEMEDQQEFLSLPVEQAMSDQRFVKLFYPSLCQSLVWHNLGLMDWIKLLETIGSIPPEKAKAWRDYEIPGSQTTKGPAHFIGPNQMQDLLDLNPDYYDEKMYQLCVLGDLEAFSTPAEAEAAAPPTKEISTRYLLVPCHGKDENDMGHVYAILDQAANGAFIRWVSEQEVEVLVAGNESAGWDQSHGVEYEERVFCPDCQPIKTKPKKSRKKKNLS